MEYIHHYESPLGAITMASDGEALIGLWFDGQKYFVNFWYTHPEKLDESAKTYDFMMEFNKLNNLKPIAA